MKELERWREPPRLFDQVFPLIDTPDFLPIDVFQEKSCHSSPSAAEIKHGITIRNRLVMPFNQRPEKLVHRKGLPQCFIAGQAGYGKLEIFGRQVRQHLPELGMCSVTLCIQP